MELVLGVAGLLAVVVAVSAAARRLGLLAPILLVVVGIVLALLVPALRELRLDAEFVLIGILPPLLYVAALEISVPAVRYNLRPILMLAIGLVIASTLAVGFVTNALRPDIPLAICLALGAIVAPPDAIAATAVARRIGLPRRLVTILEGESLFNDATALVLFKVAIAAAVGTAIGPAAIGVEVLLAAGGGIVVGGVSAVLAGWLHRRATDPLTDNAISLLTPFVVAVLADSVDASPIVAVVVTGLYLGHRLPTLMSAGSRLQMGAFWRLVKFLLEGLVFLLVGLQLPDVVLDLRTPIGEVVQLTVAVVGTAIVVRFLWIIPGTYLQRLIPSVRRSDPAPPLAVPILVSWAGMRGVITVATALALPMTLAGGQPYPRELFVWLAFAVIIVTLVGQGTTLGWMSRVLKAPRDDPQADLRAEAEIQREASAAARAALDEAAGDAPDDVVQRLRRVNARRLDAAHDRVAGGTDTHSHAYVTLRRRMIEAEREVFRRARDEGRIAEEVLWRAQHDLDLEEALLERSAADEDED